MDYRWGATDGRELLPARAPVDGQDDVPATERLKNLPDLPGAKGGGAQKARRKKSGAKS